MAALPGGQPGLRVAGDGSGPGPPDASRRPLRKLVLQLALAALAALVALRLARYCGVAPRLVGFSAVDDVARVAGASVLLFGLSGFAATRLWLPAALRRHELLWVLPVGAALSAIALTVLGFAHVPFKVSLGVVLAAGAVTSAVAWRREGSPAVPSLPDLAWPAYLAILVACVALIPVFRIQYPTVVGTGSDSILAVGTAKFLQAHPPGAIAPNEPIDQVPLVWRSKQPIYYSFGAVASLAGLETWQTLAALAAVLLALSALGFYLFAREVLGGGLYAGCLALVFTGLDRMVLHTILHPYFNQTWGYVALPFALVLTAVVARERTRSRGAIGLLVLFLALGAFAYPLALPIPLIVVAALLWRPGWWRGLNPARQYHGPRSLLWMVPVSLLLLIPVAGVVEKMISAVGVVAPGGSLANWGGDLKTWFPEHEFLFAGSTAALLVVAPFALVAIASELRRQDRRLALGLAAVLAFGLLCAVWFRVRDGGWYFHFKALAFIGPVVIAIAAVGMSRWCDADRSPWLRRAAALGLVALFVSGFHDARSEVRSTFPQLGPNYLQLRAQDRALPAGSSVRLDIDTQEQLWAGYMLSGHAQCSDQPLLHTNYPHVPVGHLADYALTDRGRPRPFDAVGARLWRGVQFDLYRLEGHPGLRSTCSRRLVETVTKIG